jgi:hypothetical protein
MSKAISWLLLGAALAVAAVALVRFNRPELPEGPRPVVWDREVCAHCKMHIGDRRFAAQLQTVDGEIFDFDDPGCLFEYLQSHHGLRTHALYFRSHDGSAWLSEAEVGFLPVDDSPMGFGIRAVPKQTPGAHGLDWAKARVSGHGGHGGHDVHDGADAHGAPGHGGS